MHCPQCGVNIPNPGLHCPACNASLKQSCSHCQFKNLIGQQFCGNCGVDLMAAQSPQLTDITPYATKAEDLTSYPVLSVELMNLSKLGEKLKNQAQLTRLTRDLLIRMESQLVSQSATIESIRENVIFFSFQQGVNLKEALAKAIKVGIALSKKVIRLQEVDLQIRVGLDVIHSVEKGPMTAVSERLVAKPGEIVVSYNVYQITNRQLPYEAIGPIKVQGELKTYFKIILDQKRPAPPSPSTTQAAPTETIASNTTAAPIASSSWDTPVTPFERKFEPQEQPGSLDYESPEFLTLETEVKQSNIGYQEAIHALERELQEVLSAANGKGEILALYGTEGIGKSTILSLLRSKIPQDALFWAGGSCYESYSKDRFPFFYWLQLLQDLLGVPWEGVPRDQAKDYLANVLKTFYGQNFTEDKAQFFETLFSIAHLQPISPDIQPLLGGMIAHIGTLLKTMATLKPVVLVLEDIQYCDSASIELLLQLIQNGLLESRIQILITGIPYTAFIGPLQQVISLLPYKEFILGAMDEPNITALAEAPLSVPWKKLPDSLRAQLVEKGSPLFLEESFRWLSQEGGFSLHPKTGKFSLERKLKQLTVPEDIWQIVQERFEKQEELCKYVLQVASVLGERFSTKALMDLTQVPDDLENVLKFLWQSGFILPDTGSMARFRHHLIWQAAYSSMTSSVKSKQHQLVADYFKQIRQSGLSINPLLIAYHQNLGENQAQALDAWKESGVWLANVGSATGATMALIHLQKLMETDPAFDDPMEKQRLMESLSILNIDARPEFAKNLLLHTLQSKEHLKPAEQLQLQLLLSQTYERLGAYSSASSTIHNAIENLPIQENASERIAMGSEELWLLYIQGSYQEARLVYTETISPNLAQSLPLILEDVGLRSSYLKGELARARISLMQCDPAAFSIIDDALTQCNLHQEEHWAIQFRLARGLSFLLKGNYEGCQRELDPMLAEIEALPHPAEAMVWWGIVVLMYHCDMGDWQNAAMLIPNTSYQAEQARNYLTWCMCQALAGKISSETGNHGEAQKLLEQAVTVSAQYHLSQPALMGWRYIAENELVMGNISVADEICKRAIEVSQKPHIQNLYEFYQLMITQAKILIHQKAFKEAGSLLEKHWPAMVISGYTPLVAEVAFQISELYRYLSADLPDPHRAKYQQQQENFLQKAKTLWQEQGNQYRLAPFYQSENATVVS